jgi:hypothetical protein
VRLQRICRQCGGRLALKDYHIVQFKSLFGRVALGVPPLYGCACEDQHAHTQTVQIYGQVNWVLEFLQSQLAATIPYARTAELLELLLPVAAGNAPSTVHRHVLSVGQRQEPIDTSPVSMQKTRQTP